MGPVLVPRGTQGELLPNEQTVLVAKFVEPALLQIGPAPYPENIAAKIPVEFNEPAVMFLGKIGKSRQNRSPVDPLKEDRPAVDHANPRVGPRRRASASLPTDMLKADRALLPIQDCPDGPLVHT